MTWTNLIARMTGLVLLFLIQPAHAQDITDLEGALAMPVSSNLVGAQNAEQFVWVQTAAGVRNVWTGGPKSAPRQLTGYTEDDGLEIYNLAISADGQKIAFVRGGDGDFPDSNIPNPAHAARLPEQQVFVADRDGTAPRVIGQGHSPVFAPDGSIAFLRGSEIYLWSPATEARAIVTVRGDINAMRFSPAGDSLLFINERDDHAYAALYRLGDEAVQYLAPGLSFAHDPAFSPDGTQIAFVRYLEPPAAGDDGRPSYWNIALADVQTGTVRTVWRAPEGRGGRYAGTRQQNLHWTDDGRLFFPWERDGWIHVYAIRPESGQDAQQITSGAFEVETFMADPDGTSLLFVANVDETDSHQLWRADKNGAAKRVTRYEGIESYPAIAGSAIAVIATDVDSPAHVALVSPQRQVLSQASNLANAITPQAVTFRAQDGVLVYGQLFQGQGAGPRPALVYVHGGPRRQMLTGFHPSSYYAKAYIFNQYMASQGFTVLSVNYRSGTGYGLDFRDAPEIARDGASEYRDVLAAGRWLAAQQGQIDPDRIGIWGGSWGGYLTALALARDSELFAAGVDLHGVHTMLRSLPSSLSPAQQEAARQLQWDSSPFGALDSWKSPVLIVHGDDDRNVPFFQSPLLARELAARGIEYEELVFPDERHSFMRHGNWRTTYLAAADFLKRKLQPESTAP